VRAWLWRVCRDCCRAGQQPWRRPQSGGGGAVVALAGALAPRLEHLRHWAECAGFVGIGRQVNPSSAPREVEGGPRGTHLVRRAAARASAARDSRTPTAKNDRGGRQGEDDEAAVDAGKAPVKKLRYSRLSSDEILPPGTRYQGGLRGLQFFVGDLVEVRREGKLQYARVARIPTDERPMDGSFIVKWDSDGEEWKCAYKELNKPRSPESAPLPRWIEDWWPAEPPPTLAEELQQAWRWVSDLRPGQPEAGGMFPDFLEDDPFEQSRFGSESKDPYRPSKNMDPRTKW